MGYGLLVLLQKTYVLYRPNMIIILWQDLSLSLSLTHTHTHTHTHNTLVLSAAVSYTHLVVMFSRSLSYRGFQSLQPTLLCRQWRDVLSMHND